LFACLFDKKDLFVCSWTTQKKKEKKREKKGEKEKRKEFFNQSTCIDMFRCILVPFQAG